MLGARTVNAVTACDMARKLRELYARAIMSNLFQEIAADSLT